jgi:hypothetical protein
MTGLEIHINKKHKSLLDHNSDLDTSGEDDIQIEEERQGHEEDDDGEYEELQDDDKPAEPMKIPSPPPDIHQQILTLSDHTEPCMQ